MTDLVAEFAVHLDEVARRHAGRPHDELDELWRIGLEREAIVTVAYRHDRIGYRLARMPLDDDARAVIARAVRWAWRDEQAHALWIRGAHMRWTEAAMALAAETRGRIGGWMSSEQHNVRWRDAPVGRTIAEAIEVVGSMTGGVPAAVRQTLKWSSFVEVCTFNHGAETTAAMAWRRMADLAGEIGDEVARRGFARMAADEERHAQVFATLRDAFDDSDRLQLATSELRARLAHVGQRFVARPDESAPAWRNPLGKGGTVFVRDGGDVAATVHALLDASGLTVHGTVAIKATFMMVTHPADPSPGVSASVLAAVIAWCEARGARVVVIEGRNLYDRFHANRDVKSVAAAIGMPGDIVDAQDDQVPHDYARGLGIETICKTWRDADVRILLGKLRSHPTSTALLSLEAAEGLGARHDDVLFMERQAERETAMLMALDAAPPHLAILDAWSDVPDGLMGVLGNDRSLQPHRLYASTDAVALDLVACRHIGATEHDGMLVDMAVDWFGSPDTVVDGPGTPIAGFRIPQHSARTALLGKLALPMYTLASGRGALFLPEFSDDFPALQPSRVLDLARGLIRKLVADPPSEPRGAGLLPTTMVDGIRVARIGRGNPLVCLHGYPETLQIWSALLPRLDRECIAFDWPGLGYSQARGDCSPDALAEQLREVIDKLGLDRVDLLAGDMGAPPALVFAARYPERAGKVTCTSAMLFGDAPTSIEISIMRTQLAKLAFAMPRLVYNRCIASLADAPLPSAIDEDFAGAFMKPTVRDRVAAMCDAYNDAFDTLPATYWKIRCPVQLVWAEHDHHFGIEHAQRFCDLVPTAKLDVVPGAKHWMMLSRPAALAVHL